jgi:hypothetical protein
VPARFIVAQSATIEPIWNQIKCVVEIKFTAGNDELTAIPSMIRIIIVNAKPLEAERGRRMVEMADVMP